MKKNSGKIILIVVLLSLLAVGFYFLTKKTPGSELAGSLICRDCNVVFIAYDALQAAHVSHLGYDKQTTPVMDAMAKYGASFSNTISPASWTVPSYMSVFSGLYPSEHKLVNKYTIFTKENQIIANIKNLSPQVQTLAQVLKTNGYATGGFTGDAGVHSMFGYNQGFDVYTDEKSFGSFENSADHALAWLRDNKDRKFFLFLHGYDSHGQFQVGDNYQGRFVPKDYNGQYKGTSQEQAALREQALANGSLNPTTADIDFWRGLYDSKISDADSRVGNFMDEFDKLNLNKKTIFVIFSDHGTEVFEHNKVDHGFSLYDELLHVPMVFIVPGMPSGLVVDNQVSTMDISPTVIRLLGISPGNQFASQLRGVSLIPLLEGKKMPERNIFSETDYRDYTHKRSVRTHDKWKFIISLENGHKELYNLQVDPGEKKNLINNEPGKADELYQLLKIHLTQMGSNIEKSLDTGCLPVYGDQCKLDQLQQKRPSNQIQEYF